MPPVTRWSEAGNSLYRTAHVQRTQTPLPIFVLDGWLAYAHAPLDWMTNWLQERNKVGISWLFAWPCYGYTQVWLPRLTERQDHHVVEVGFDDLSSEYRARLTEKDRGMSGPARRVDSHGR